MYEGLVALASLLEPFVVPLVLIDVFLLSPLIALAYYGIAYQVVPGFGAKKRMAWAMRRFFIGCGSHHVLMAWHLVEHGQFMNPLLIVGFVIVDFMQVEGGTVTHVCAIQERLSFVLQKDPYDSKGGEKVGKPGNY